MDQLPRLGKRELICLLSFACNYVVFVWRGFLFLWVLRMGYVILLWHSLSLPYNYFLCVYILYQYYSIFFTLRFYQQTNIQGGWEGVTTCKKKMLYEETHFFKCNTLLLFIKLQYKRVFGLLR